MSGAFGRELDRLLTEASIGDLVGAKSFPKLGRYKDDVADFVKEFKRGGLMEYLPGRHHIYFKDFSLQTYVKSPEKLGQKFRKYAENMDMWKNIMQ